MRVFCSRGIGKEKISSLYNMSFFQDLCNSPDSCLCFASDKIEFISSRKGNISDNVFHYTACYPSSALYTMVNVFILNHKNYSQRTCVSIFIIVSSLFRTIFVITLLVVHCLNFVQHQIAIIFPQRKERNVCTNVYELHSNITFNT